MSHASKSTGPVVVELEPVARARRAPRGRSPCRRRSRRCRPRRSVTRRCSFSSVSPSTPTASLAGSTGRADAVRRRLDARAAGRSHDLAPRERRRVHRRASPAPTSSALDAGLDLGEVALARPRRRAGSTSRGGCRGTAGAAAASRAGRARRADSRRRARRARNSASCSACSQRRLPRFVRPASCTCRGGTRSTARRRRPGGSPGSASSASKNSSRRRDARARQALQVARRGGASRASSRVGPPPPSPWPKTSRLVRDCSWSLYSRAVFSELRHVGHRVVGVGRREVHEHLAAVDPLPDERVVLGLVEAVPRELLREEARDAGAAHQLRQLAVVAERVRAPELACSGAPNSLLEEALAVQELPHERLAGGDVAVGLDPAAADRHELARRRPSRGCAPRARGRAP